MKNWHYVLVHVLWILELKPIMGRVVVQDSVVRMRRIKRQSIPGLSQDFKALFERRLQDNAPKIFSRKFMINHSDNYKKLKFMKIVASILETARTRNLSVKKIKLGSHLKRIFENANLKQSLAEFINDPKFMQKYRSEKKRYRRYLKLKKQRLMQLKETSKKAEILRKLNPKKQAISFEYGPTGFPIPPIRVGGPVFHPPMNVTINALPNPNPRTETDPISLELEDLNIQKRDLTEIRKKITDNQGLKDALDDLKISTTNAAAKSFTSTTNLLS
jgi:hypothetical protein